MRNCPKRELVAAVQVMLGQHRLKFAARLPMLEVLLDELRAFEVQVTAAANVTYNARVGTHDDLVLAVAQAAWWTERNAPADFRDSYRSVSTRRSVYDRPRGSRNLWRGMR